jgi:hypothetical protein
MTLLILNVPSLRTKTWTITSPAPAGAVVFVPRFSSFGAMCAGSVCAPAISGAPNAAMHMQAIRRNGRFNFSPLRDGIR